MKKYKIAAFTAHPDDVECRIAGTLARYAADGHEVYTVVATDGRRGNALQDKDMPWQNVVEIRKKEAQAAASHIGAEAIFLGFEDHRLVYDAATYERFADVIGKISPDIVFALSPDDYHSDHRAVGRLVTDVCWAPLFYMDTTAGVGFEPQFYVDITQQYEIKKKMMKEHVSQDAQRLVQITDLTNRFRGMQCANKKIIYAEAFRVYPRFNWVKAYELLPRDFEFGQDDSMRLIRPSAQAAVWTQEQIEAG